MANKLSGWYCCFLVQYIFTLVQSSTNNHELVDWLPSVLVVVGIWVAFVLVAAAVTVSLALVVTVVSLMVVVVCCSSKVFKKCWKASMHSIWRVHNISYMYWWMYFTYLSVLHHIHNKHPTEILLDYLNPFSEYRH